MRPFESILFCPRCAARNDSAPSIPFRCGACGFVFYFNATVSVSAFILRADGDVLLISRAKEPARGKLGTVGGFVDIGETAEGALQREIREEIGVEVRDVRFLTSHPNNYDYAGITYPVLDLFFICNLSEGARVLLSAEVNGIVWRKTEEIEPEELAFDSMRVALGTLKKLLGSQK